MGRRDNVTKLLHIAYEECPVHITLVILCSQRVLPPFKQMMAILDYINTCLRIKLAKERIMISIDNQSMITTLAASKTKRLRAVNCIQKLTLCQKRTRQP